MDRESDGELALPSRFVVVVEEGPPRGGLFELEQTTSYHIVDRASNATVLTLQEHMEARLSTSTGLWDEYHYSGIREVRISPDQTSVVITRHDGTQETLPLPI